MVTALLADREALSHDQPTAFGAAGQSQQIAASEGGREENRVLEGDLR